MDQTRFSTVQGGVEVAQQLFMPEAQRQNWGHSFVVTLLVGVPHQLEPKPLDIIVDRVSPDYKADRLANRDAIVDTVARLAPSGDAFDISVLLKMGEQPGEDVRVFVSPDMETMILRQFGQEADDELDFLLESG